MTANRTAHRGFHRTHAAATFVTVLACAFVATTTVALADTGSLPLLTLTQTPTGQNGWWSTAPAIVAVQATDPNGVASLTCTLAGSPFPLQHLTTTATSMSGDINTTHQGIDQLVCTASDSTTNTATASTDVKIDYTPPGVLPFGPLAAVRVGQPSTFATSAWDTGGSGLAGGEFWVGTPTDLGTGYPTVFGDPTPVRGTTGLTVSGNVPGQTAPNLYAIYTSVYDGAGEWARGQDAGLAVWDPSAGSVSGSGWVVPGGATSDRATAWPDQLPGLDRTSKATFNLSIQYQNVAATTPTGPMSLAYDAGQFHFKGQSLQWLVVAGATTAYVEGTGTIQGSSSAYPFLVELRDGKATGQPDRYTIVIDPPGTDPLWYYMFEARSTLLYKASGDVQGGQVKIQQP